MAEHICGQVHTWDLLPTDTGWRLDFEKLESLINQQTRLLVVNFPHNPTGFLPQLADLKRLIELAKRHDTWLFCDEMYRGLEFGRAPMLPSAIDLGQRVIVLTGLSKTHGLAGLRAGWLLVKDEEIRAELMNWKFYTTICPSAPSEFLAKAALKAGDQLLNRAKDTIRHNLLLAEQFFQRWPDQFSWRSPMAGSVALVGISEPSATAYCHELAQTAGLLLLPGPCLGADDRHVRFGFGRTSFPAALGHYEDYLQMDP